MQTCLNPHCGRELVLRHTCWGLCSRCWHTCHMLIATGQVQIDDLIRLGKIELPRPHLKLVEFKTHPRRKVCPTTKWFLDGKRNGEQA